MFPLPRVSSADGPVWRYTFLCRFSIISLKVYGTS